MNQNLIELVALLMLELDTKDITLDHDQLQQLHEETVRITNDWETGQIRIEIVKVEETEEQPN